MIKSHTYRGPLALSLSLSLAAFLALASCDDSPTEPDEDHHEPESIQITMGSQALVTYDVEASSWDGGLEAQTGDFGPLTIEFLDHDGDVIAEEDAYLDVQVADASVADWQPTSAGAYSGVLQGGSVGQTTWTIRLMHGAVGAGHPDLVANPLTVTVR